MFKKLSLIIGIAIALLMIQGGEPAIAQNSTVPWYAEYYNNMTVSGTPVMTRTEPDLWLDWGTGSPQIGVVDVDGWSARFTQTQWLPAGRYRFTTITDDGVRLWVNGVLLIDEWYDQTSGQHSAEIVINSTSSVPIMMHYYDRFGDAEAKLDWHVVGSPPPDYDWQNWRGEYYNNTELYGSPSLIRDDEQINFDWGYGSPANAVINPDFFSVRWTQPVHFDHGRYQFWTTSDDGVRLWVNGQLIIDHWHAQQATTISAEIDLPGGTVEIKMEYFERTHGAQARLTWSQISSIPLINSVQANYWNNLSLWGDPVLSREELAVDHVWGMGSPGIGVNADYFSARWTVNANLGTGLYRFHVRSDDGVRLWVNGIELIDEWYDHGLTTFSNDLYISGGNVTIVMEYYEKTHWAEAHLWWDQLTGP